MVLIINGVDYTDMVDEFSVDTEVTYTSSVTTLDGTEHWGRPIRREKIKFSLFPMTGEEASKLYSELHKYPIIASYMSPNFNNSMVTSTMRVDGTLQHKYWFESMELEEYYSIEPITLVSKYPL